jgi:hypothetical protein
MELVILAFILVVVALAPFYGVDSRVDEQGRRDWRRA